MMVLVSSFALADTALLRRSLFVVGPVVIDLVTLVKCSFHSHSVALSAQLNLEIGQSSNRTWRSI